MNARKLVIACIVASAAPAGASVPAELIGTWAAASIDCTRVGPTTLSVTEEFVTRAQIRGSILGGRSIGRRSVEVMFDRESTGSHALRVRLFRLSTDGSELYELDGDKVVERRRRCAVPQGR